MAERGLDIRPLHWRRKEIANCNLQSSISSQLYGPSSFGRAIDAEDNLYRFTSLTAVDKRLRAGFNGADEVSQLPGVSYMGDSSRIAGSPRRTDLLGKPLFHRAVLRHFRGEIPMDHVLLFDHDRSFVSMHGNG